MRGCIHRTKPGPKPCVETRPSRPVPPRRPRVYLDPLPWPVYPRYSHTICFYATCGVVTEDGVPQSRKRIARLTLARHVRTSCLLCVSQPVPHARVYSRARSSKQNQDHTIDISRDAQVRDIDASFAAVANSDLASLRHPTKPELTAVEEFEIFPDAEIWANAYDLFRFSERPGDRPVDVSVYVYMRNVTTLTASAIGRGPATGLRGTASYGGRWGPLPRILPHEGRRGRARVQAQSTRALARRPARRRGTSTTPRRRLPADAALHTHSRSLPISTSCATTRLSRSSRRSRTSSCSCSTTACPPIRRAQRARTTRTSSARCCSRRSA